MSRFLNASIVGIVLAAFSALPAAAATPSLKSLVAQTSDVNSVFGSAFKTHQQSAMALQDLQLLGIYSAGGNGWVAGYYSEFDYPVRHLKSGVSVVNSSVSRYSTAAAPQAGVNLLISSRATLVAQMRAMGVKNLNIVRLHGVGDMALMATSSVVVKNKSVATLNILFTRGRFADTVGLYGSGSLSKNQAVSLALRMDRRIQHAK